MEFLEHEKELRRLQLLKEVSIADAEERAFKRVIDEEQTYMRPEYWEEKYTKVNTNSRLTVVFMNVRTLIQTTLVFMTNMFSFLCTNNT